MAYATPAQLAVELHVALTAENTPVLQDCLDAAAVEIDHHLQIESIVAPPEPLLVRTNLNRAVEWYKAPAVYNGGVGTPEVGTMKAPTSGFERHAAALLPFKVSWGLA